MTSRLAPRLGAAALFWLAAGARAESAGPATDAEPPQDAAATGSPSIEDRLARQETAIEELRASMRTQAEASKPPAVQVSGYTQVDWVVHDQTSQDEINPSTGAPLNQDRFVLRRGHVRLASSQGPLFGAVEMDLNTVQGPQVRPIEAQLGARWPESERAPGDFGLSFGVGLMRIPFGFEVVESDAVRPFLERSTVLRALFPGAFDLGARLTGRFRGVEGTVAIMNGSPIGDRAFPALAPTARKDLIGRLGARANVWELVDLEAGVSFETGEGLHEGTPTTKDQVVWHDTNGDGIVQATEIDVIAGSSSTPSQSFHRFATGADARVSVRTPLGELGLRFEVVRSVNLDRGVEYADPVAARHDLRELGWTIGATQELTAWAMIGARYDRYNPDDDASEQRAAQLSTVDRTYSTWALVAMGRYRGARLTLEYDKNTNALGRDVSGAPTTLRSDALTARAQWVF